MLISYVSDLHLEFNENKEFVKANPLIPSGEILLIAGDMVTFEKLNSKAMDFISWCSDSFFETYAIPGNHEFYSSDINIKPFHLNEKIKDNFSLVNNVKIKHKDIDIIFSTMWTGISPINEAEIAGRMNDFRIIRNGERLFTPSDYSLLHKKSLAFIKQAVKDSGDKKKIVVSHHVPTFKNYPEKYKGDILNEAFAVELFDYIEDSNINYFLYGHNHYNQPQFSIGNTKLITNQLGYVRYGENGSFRRDATIEI